MHNNLIPYSRIVQAFEKVGWVKKKSSSTKYDIYVNPQDESIWTRVPNSATDIDYQTYQHKNILVLLYALSIDETKENIQDLISQLKQYNYKLTNRIQTNPDHSNSVIPFELANLIPEKNIDAFRYFYHTKTKQKSRLPIEKFEFNHTEVGSFVIPISIVVDDNPNTLVPMQNDLNIQLHKYLQAVEALTKAPRNDSIRFADSVMSDSIDSKIVKDFFGSDHSIARYREKYEDTIKSISVGSRGSMLLDYELPAEERFFPEVDLGSIAPLNKEFLEVLEEKEVKANEASITEADVNIDVVVEAIDTTGRAKFTVMAIADDEVDKPFKAASIKLPKAKLDQFADYFKNGDIITIKGDIEKSKGKLGTINVDTLKINQTTNQDERTSLFE